VHQDPEYFYQLCRFRVLGGKYDRAAEACRAARELDSHFAGAFWLEAQSGLLLDDTAAGTESLAMCLRIAPGATSCMNDLLQLEINGGQCDAAARDAQRLVAIAPDAASLADLAMSSFAIGKTIDMARTTLERAADLLPADDTSVERAILRTRLAVLGGKVDEAFSHLDEWNRATVSAADESEHVPLFRERTWLLRELGRDAEITALSRSITSTRSAWVPASDLDLKILADTALYRAGAISRDEFAAERGGWIAAASQRPWSSADGFGPARRWLASYAEGVNGQDDAREALAALPQYLPLPSERVRTTADDEVLGRTYLLAGRIPEAISFLRRAASSCRATHYPLHHTWANLELGLALESTNPVGACEAYRVVLDRWGSVSGSQSAAIARSRRSAMQCK